MIEEPLKALEKAVRSYLKAAAGDCPFCDLKRDDAGCECGKIAKAEEKAESEILALAKKHRRSHACEYSRRDLLKQFYKMGDIYSGESLGIYRCTGCRRLWMIRFQHDAGTGSDDIWLTPGESERGYEFTLEEAVKYRDKESVSKEEKNGK